MSKMLVLSRRAGESILLTITLPQPIIDAASQDSSDSATLEIKLQVLSTAHHSCRLGFTAPACCKIVRAEILE